MKFIVHATRRTPHGASRLVQAMPVSSIIADVLRPGIVGMKESMVIRLRPCTPPPPLPTDINDHHHDHHHHSNPHTHPHPSFNSGTARQRPGRADRAASTSRQEGTPPPQPRPRKACFYLRRGGVFLGDSVGWEFLEQFGGCGEGGRREGGCDGVEGVLGAAIGHDQGILGEKGGGGGVD